MSSILRALRKIEEQKGNGSGPRPDIMQDKGHANGRGNPYLPLLGGACLGVLLVLLIYLLVGVERPVTPSPAPLAGSPALPAPAMPAPVSAAPVAVRPLITEPVTTEADKAVPLSTVSAAVAAQQPAASVKIEPATPGAAQAALSQALPEGVELVVSEVYPQPDKASSMAVVNDLPVMIGTAVGSAVVEDISDSGVVFVIDGELHVVPIVPDADLVPGGN
jgi:hypothetical protein